MLSLFAHEFMFCSFTAYSLTSHKTCSVTVMAYVNERPAVPGLILPALVRTNAAARNEIKALVTSTRNAIHVLVAQR